MSERITQVQFEADRNTGARVVSRVFASLPIEGEYAAWDNQAAADRYVASWPADERADVGGYYVPWTPAPEDRVDGVTTIVTPSSGRSVSYWPSGQLWTVDFGDEGSEVAAQDLLAALDERDGGEVGSVHVAYAEEDHAQHA